MSLLQVPKYLISSGSTWRGSGGSEKVRCVGLSAAGAVRHTAITVAPSSRFYVRLSFCPQHSDNVLGQTVGLPQTSHQVHKTPCYDVWESGTHLSRQRGTSAVRVPTRLV